MKKQTAIAIAKNIDSFVLEALELYVADRIENLRQQLESSDELIDIHRFQGRISELKQLLKIRESAKNTEV